MAANSLDPAGRIEAWWAERRLRDFSWEGLSKHLWEGWVVADGVAVDALTGARYGEVGGTQQRPPDARAATLQDYWRADTRTGKLRDDAQMRGELTHGGEPGSFTIKRYHVAHLPLTNPNGTSTFKDEWNQHTLDRLIESRLRLARPRRLLHVEADHRAQFQGLIWLGFPAVEAERAMACDWCAFARAASFSRAIASSTSFANAVFLGDVRFSQTEFGHHVSFVGAIFAGAADFPGTSWSNDARFDDAVFLRAAPYFHSSNFSGGVRFARTDFREGADFTDCRFATYAGFREARFGGDASFLHARINETAAFSEAEFFGAARFDRAELSGRVDFTNARFARFASFTDTTWPTKENQWRGSLRQAIFEGPLIFDRLRIPFAALDGARIQHGIALGSSSEAEADRWLEEQIANIEPSSPTGGVDELHPPSYWRQEALAALESGCRVLKQAMAGQTDKAREQMFYRFELIARRRQAATPLTERVFSWLYGATSNYGASIGRPLGSLALLVAAFAALFWVADPPRTTTSALDAINFSASRVFPFGAFEEVSKRWIEAFETADTLATLGIRVLASLESAFAATLLFLLALAVRRKFQIG